MVPLTPTELLRAREPRLTGGGRALRCASEAATTIQLEGVLATAEDSLSYMEFSAASAQLQAAGELLACLDEPAPPSLGARLFFLEGVVAQRSGSELMAKQSFRRALFFDPQLQWDEAVSPRARPLFEEVRSSPLVADASLRVVGPASLILDGREVRLEDGVLALPSGTHLLYADGVTITVAVLPGEAPVLVLPASVTDDALAWVATETGRDALGLLISHAGEESAWVTTGAALWHWNGHWEFLGHPDDVLPPRGTPALLATGGAVALAGGAAALAGYARATSSGGEADATNAWVEYEVLASDYERGVRTMRSGKIVAAGGLALAATGAAFYLKPNGAATVAAGPGSLFLTLQW